MITVVIPNWNGRGWLPGCLAALAGQEGDRHPVIGDQGVKNAHRRHGKNQ